MTSCINDQFCAVWRHACRSCPSASARSSAPCHSVGSRAPPSHPSSRHSPRANPPPPASARRSPPAGVRSGPQGRHATALKGGSSREPTCLEQIGSAMSKGNLAHHHTCSAFCPRYLIGHHVNRAHCAIFLLSTLK